MSDVRMPARLRREGRREAAYRALQRRFGAALLLAIYDHGLLTQVVIQERGQPRILNVEDENPQAGEDIHE